MKTTINILSICSLFIFVSCGGTMAQTNVSPVPPPAVHHPVTHAMQTAAKNLARVRAGCPIGMSINCGKVRNGLGPGLAIVEIRVNDGPPIVMNSNAGSLPLPRLLDGESTDFVWPQCTRRNQFGSCVYKFVGFAVPIVDMTGMFPGVDPNSEEYQLLIQADLKNGEKYCFEEELAVSLGMRQNGMFVPSINPEYVINECPFGKVPKSVATAAAQQ
jgi:hypothetical protein